MFCSRIQHCAPQSEAKILGTVNLEIFTRDLFS